VPRTLQQDSAALPTGTDHQTDRAETVVADSRTDPVRARTQSILRDLFGPAEERDFAVRYWDGTLERPGAVAAPPFTIVLKHPGSLARMLLPPSQLRIGEAYVRGDFEIEGNMEAAAGLATRLRDRLASPVAAARLMMKLRRLPRAPRRRWRAERRLTGRHLGSRHSPRRDAAAVRFHYDIGNDFYALWLDERMVYSCAYFPTGTEDIHSAQLAKLEYLCRKLRLQPGEKLLDIGCGWGALVRHAVEHHGVEALGITLSEPQAKAANHAIAESGLAGRCRVEVRDYRDLPSEPAYQKIVSVGMVEHVGRKQLKTYFERVCRLLHPGGLFLNHGITWVAEPAPAGLTRLLPRWNWREGKFMDRYVFPDGDLVTLDLVIAAAESAGLETRDVENLREHYMLTLRNWVRRLEGSAREAIALAGENAYRTWRLYMSACANRFASGRMALSQVLLAKPDASGHVSLPLTRADLYSDNLYD
jgi:cyclopropane-fatty-acyl-phospholipid synthase